MFFSLQAGAEPCQIFWAGDDMMQVADCDGTNQNTIVPSLGSPAGVALDLVNNKVYWTDFGANKIQRSDLDGSNVEDLVDMGDDPQGIALDVSAGKMYWTDLDSSLVSRIRCANMNIPAGEAPDNRTDIVNLVGSGLGFVTGVALDLSAGKIYWCDTELHRIQRADLDGSNLETLVTALDGLDEPTGIALDVAADKMYWTDFALDKIQRADLDGTGVEDLIRSGSGLSEPFGIAVDVGTGSLYWSSFNLGQLRTAGIDIPGGETPDNRTDIVNLAACTFPRFLAPTLPRLINVCGGVRAADPTTYISPVSANGDFDSFTIQVSEPVGLVSGSVTIATTGGVAPTSLTLTPGTSVGEYVAQLDAPVPQQEWATITLTVANAAGVEARMCLRVAHLPADVNQDGNVGLADASAFVSEFNGQKRPCLVDSNNDGQVGLADVSDWVNNFNGNAGIGIPQGNGTFLPAMPTCP
jgi:DNA-binding beta-propeller fold protein YncE